MRAIQLAESVEKALQELPLNCRKVFVWQKIEGLTQAEIAERLQVEVTAPVYKIIRLRLLDEKPYVLEHTYMPCDLVPGLDESILLQSIYAYLWDELNLKFAGSYRHITAEKPDEYDQNYLACQETDPILQVEQVVYLETGRPIEYSRSRNRFDTRGYSLLDVKNI